MPLFLFGSPDKTTTNNKIKTNKTNEKHSGQLGLRARQEQIKIKSAIFASLMCSLLPEDFHLELILSSLHLAMKRLHVHHHSAYYIFSGPLGSFGLLAVSLQLVLCRVASVKRLPGRHHSADYIFSGHFEII